MSQGIFFSKASKFSITPGLLSNIGPFAVEHWPTAVEHLTKTFLVEVNKSICCRTFDHCCRTFDQNHIVYESFSSHCRTFDLKTNPGVIVWPICCRTFDPFKYRIIEYYRRKLLKRSENSSQSRFHIFLYWLSRNPLLKGKKCLHLKAGILSLLLPLPWMRLFDLKIVINHCSDNLKTIHKYSKVSWSNDMITYSFICMLINTYEYIRIHMYSYAFLLNQLNFKSLKHG